MNAATIRILVEKGLSAQDILEIAESMDAPKQRSAAAERQARYRARRKAEEVQADTVTDGVTDGVTDNVTRDGNERNAAPLSLPLSTHTPVKKQPARKGHRLPEDWQPKPLTTELAKSVSAWPVGAVERELARFRDWAAAATGPNATKSDWDAAWRNWLRKAEDEGRYRKPTNDNKSTANATERARAILNGRA